MKHTCHILLISVLVFTMCSCKKKEPEAPTIDPATGCTNCLPSSATTYFGLFKAGTYTATAPASISTITARASVFFGSQPANVPSLANSTTVNAVFFNADSLRYTGAPYYYTNYLPVNLSSETWSVSGNSTIPSFTFKNLKEKPGYGSMSAWPDTVRKGVGFVLVIRDLKNITAGSLIISDGLALPTILTKAISSGGTDTLTFTSSTLMSLISSTNAVITLFMENSFAIKVDGKDFKMSNEASYSKKVVIKN